MAGIPVNLPIPGATAVASYSFSDIAEGTGIVKYYGVVSSTGGTRSYFLTQQQMISKDTITSGAVGTAGTSTRISNNNFDITFNRPQNIKGKAFLVLSLGGYMDLTNGTNTLFISGAAIQKVFNSVTTTIATQSSDTLTRGTIGEFCDKMVMQFDVSASVYHFERGSTLRLNLPVWATSSGTSTTSYAGYGTDPNNGTDPTLRTISGSAFSTALNLYVPYVLNV